MAIFGFNFDLGKIADVLDLAPALESGTTTLDEPTSIPTADVADTEIDAPIATISNPETGDVVADAGPVPQPFAIQVGQIPTGALVAGGVVTFVLIVLALARAKARKRAAQVGAVAGFINRIRGK